MPSLTFRVLDSAPRRAAEHMALDEVIMKAHSEGNVPNTLRFLQFKPCALVGLHQNVDLEVNVPYCREQGVAINRRITGGGSLYWGPLELGWELYAKKSTPGIPRKVEAMYQLLCEGTAWGLKKIGLDAAYRPINDIEVKGRKIAGTGGTELEGSFMFQCSLLIDFDVRQMLKVLRTPMEKLGDKAVKSMRERVTSMHEQLGYVPEHKVIKQAIIAGLSERLEGEFYPGELTFLEEKLFQERLPYFQSNGWIFGEENGFMNTVDCFANYKAPGGLIRVQIRLDEQIRLIKYVMITGDFFAYPARVINDLENLLKNTPIHQGRMAQRIINFFGAYQAEIPGVTAKDFITVITMAIDQAKSRQLRGHQGGRE